MTLIAKFKYFERRHGCTFSSTIMISIQLLLILLAFSRSTWSAVPESFYWMSEPLSVTESAGPLLSPESVSPSPDAAVNSSSQSIDAIVKPISTLSLDLSHTSGFDEVDFNKSNQKSMHDSNSINGPIAAILDASRHASTLNVPVPTPASMPSSLSSSNISSSNRTLTSNSPVDLTYVEYSVRPNVRTFSNEAPLIVNQSIEVASQPASNELYDSLPSPILRHPFQMNTGGPSDEPLASPAPLYAARWEQRPKSITMLDTSQAYEPSYGKSAISMRPSSFDKKYRSPKENISYGKPLSFSTMADHHPSHPIQFITSTSGETSDPEITFNHSPKSMDYSFWMDSPQPPPRPATPVLSVYPKIDTSSLIFRRLPLTPPISWSSSFSAESPPVFPSSSLTAPLPANPLSLSSSSWYMPPTRSTCCWSPPSPMSSRAPSWPRSPFSFSSPIRSSFRSPSLIMALADGASRYAAELNRMRSTRMSPNQSPPAIYSPPSPLSVSLPPPSFSSAYSTYASSPPLPPYNLSPMTPRVSTYSPLIHHQPPYGSTMPLLSYPRSPTIWSSPEDTQLQQFKIK